MMINCSW